MVLLISLGAALFAAFALDRVNFPAGALIGAMVAIAALKLFGGGAPNIPGIVRFGALVIVGWDLGTRFNRELIDTVSTHVVSLLVVVLCFLVTGWALAWMLYKLGVMDPVTAVLATSPGGLVQMGALTSEVEANAGLVVGFHLLRIVSVLLSAPLISRLVET